MSKSIFNYRSLIFLAIITLISTDCILADQCYIAPGKKWTAKNVTYTYNVNLSTFTVSHSDFITQVQNAISQWNNAGANFKFNRDQFETACIEGNEGTTLHQLSVYEAADGKGARTVTVEGSVMTKCNTYFNKWYNLTTSTTNPGWDIWNLTVHELGHWLYLDDEIYVGCANNVMYYDRYSGDITRRLLTSDDKAGIRSLYGNGSTSVYDILKITTGSTVINQNTNNSYGAVFYCYDTPQDYIVGNYTWNLIVRHDEGEYVAASGTTSGASWTCSLGTLPYGYAWIRDGVGNVMAKICVSAMDNDGCNHGDEYPIGISGVPVNTTSGTLTHNEKWSREHSVSGNIIVPSGIQLTILSGATIKFAQGTSLLLNGKMIVQSDACFTAQSGTTPGSWGPIQFSGSGADGSSINQSTIQYGTEIDVFSAPNVTIQGCSILNSSSSAINYSGAINGWVLNNIIANSNQYHGIVVQNGSNVLCGYNKIYKSDHNGNGVGIFYSGGGTGTFIMNDVAYYNWGVGAIWGSSPSSQIGYSAGRNNRITNCSYGLEIYQQSYPIIGGSSPSDYMWNSVYSNSYNPSLPILVRQNFV